MSDSTRELMLACVEAALDRKAYDLVVLHTAEHTSVADYFVLCSARSDTQVQAIADGGFKSISDIPEPEILMSYEND